MSEKYSTEELVNELETIITEANASEQFKYHKLNRRIFNAVIARLRAGDKLCEAANFIAEEIAGFADDDHAEYQILIRLRKAIAKYKEEK